MQYCASMVYAEYALENLHIKAKSQEFARQAGRRYKMTMTDPIADMLTRIRNGLIARHETVDIPASKIKMAIGQILVEEGFVKSCKLIEEKDKVQNTIRIELKYAPNKERVIKGLKKISKPGLRVYAKSNEIPKVLGGLGIAIVSTSSGVMTDKKARKIGAGGEVLAYVW